MLEDPPLLRIKRNLRRPTEAQVAAFQGVPTGFVVDALGGMGALSSAIQPLGAGRDIECVAAGPALTVDCGPADILATQAAMAFIRTGDVVVVAFGGHQGCAAAGDRVAGMMKNNGAAGFVTDGPVRDYAGLVGVGLPVWCTGLTPATPFAKGPGAIGLPIQIGGQEVETGDMVVADSDGVVVVPFERIDEVASKLVEIREMEAAADAKVAAGLKVSPKIADLLSGDSVKYVD